MEIIEYLAGLDVVKARAIQVGNRIATKAIEKSRVLAGSPLVVELSLGSCVVIFKYGVAVFFNTSSLDEARFVEILKGFAEGEPEDAKAEELDVFFDPAREDHLEDHALCLQDLSIKKLQVVATCLSKSVILDYYESKVAKSFELVEPIAAKLKTKGHRGAQPKELLRHIGEVLITQHNMVGRVEVVEKPELLWEHPELEKLYAMLAEELEIRERHRLLERKLELISRTAETVHDLLQTKHGLRLEWYIIILIMVEIVLSLYAMFFQQGVH